MGKPESESAPVAGWFVLARRARLKLTKIRGKPRPSGRGRIAQVPKASVRCFLLLDVLPPNVDGRRRRQSMRETIQGSAVEDHATIFCHEDQMYMHINDAVST